MADALAFFLEYGGYSWDPARETREAGRRRSALELATAEEWARGAGLECEWRDDWAVGDHRAEYGEAYAEGEPTTCEVACLLDAAGRVLASLGCVDGATSAYRRVVCAELALEVMPAAVPLVAMGGGL
jgi:hypothetical protein